MRDTRALCIALTLLLLSGCAPLRPYMQPSVRICSDSPKSTVVLFLEGLTKGLLGLEFLKMAILAGVDLFSIFGDGDPVKGRKIVEAIVDHAELKRNNEVDSIYSYVDMRVSGDVHLVTIRRQVEIFRFTKDGLETRKELYQREFLVSFDQAGNCITSVRPADADWQLEEPPTRNH